MRIAAIRHSVEVKANPARAYDLFMTQMGQWWPRGCTVGANPHAAIVVEPQAGGRWFERDEIGNETQWGKVLAWEPPQRTSCLRRTLAAARWQDPPGTRRSNARRPVGGVTA